MKSALILAVVFTCLALSFAQDKNKKNPTPDHSSDGAQLFAENCGRCHRPPDQLSPKVVGSVLRHMRVRATLSKEDEQAILKYLAP